MYIKKLFSTILKKLWIRKSSIMVKTTSLCMCGEDATTTKLLTKIITLKSPIGAEYAAECHGLDYDKIRGYTVELNMNDYHWLSPNSHKKDTMYDAWVSNRSVVIKVGLDKPLTLGRTVHFVINYLP